MVTGAGGVVVTGVGAPVVGGTVVTGAGGTVVTGGAVFGGVVGVVTDVQARVQVTEPSPCPNAVAGLMMLTAAVMTNVKNVFFMSKFSFSFV